MSCMCGIIYERKITIYRSLFRSERCFLMQYILSLLPVKQRERVSGKASNINQRFVNSCLALSKCLYRGIFVYPFCLINICLSLSDNANKIKTLNIERASQFQLSLKIWGQHTEWFRRNSLLKTRNFTENVWLINFFATQQFCRFWWLIFLSILLAKSWKLHKLPNFISSFDFCF